MDWPHEVRFVQIGDGSFLPSGNYRFVDTYCVDPACDCRKTIIQVYHEDVIISLISYE